MRFIPNKYLTIPINPRLGRCDLFLAKAMETVAIAKGYKNAKRYLKSELGCSGASVKHMLRTKVSSRSANWDLDEHKTRDAYCYIRKLDKEKYAVAVKLIIDEYFEIVSKSEREDLLDYIKAFGLKTSSYQRALCYKAIDGLETVDFDPATANRINRIEDAKTIANGISALLLGNEVVV